MSASGCDEISSAVSEARLVSEIHLFIVTLSQNILRCDRNLVACRNERKTVVDCDGDATPVRRAAVMNT